MNGIIDGPLVSVIVPAYNAAPFISSTIESILAQTYQRFEVLVVDDGSQDETASIVRRYLEKDDRIVLQQQNNRGVAAARNQAISIAKGEYIAPIDADDIWFPQNLEKQITCFLESNANVGAVYSRSIDIDESGFPTGGFNAADISGKVFLNLLCHNFIGNASSTMLRRSCLEQVGLYSTEMREKEAGGCEDWDLYLRIAEHFQFAAVPKFLVGYRRHQGTMSRSYDTMARSQELMLTELAKRHPEIPERAYRFSKSSLYIYFAHICNRERSTAQTLYWLRRAHKEARFFSLVRFGFYRLLVANYIRSLLPEDSCNKEVAPIRECEKAPARNIAIQRGKVSLMLAAEKIFSWAVPFVFNSDKIAVFPLSGAVKEDGYD